MQNIGDYHLKTILLYKQRKIFYRQQVHNHALSSKRVSVEHLFCPDEKIRGQSIAISEKLQLGFNRIAGIHNLRFSHHRYP